MPAIASTNRRRRLPGKTTAREIRSRQKARGLKRRFGSRPPPLPRFVSMEAVA